MPREAVLERRCATLAQRRGGWLLKLLPIVTGLPDRLLLAPRGRACFVEFKTPRGALSRRQHFVRLVLHGLGFRVFVVRNMESFKAVLDEFGLGL
jgi:hypothetical protein